MNRPLAGIAALAAWALAALATPGGGSTWPFDRSVLGCLVVLVWVAVALYLHAWSIDASTRLTGISRNFMKAWKVLLVVWIVAAFLTFVKDMVALPGLPATSTLEWKALALTAAFFFAAGIAAIKSVYRSSVIAAAGASLLSLMMATVLVGMLFVGSYFAWTTLGGGRDSMWGFVETMRGRWAEGWRGGRDAMDEKGGRREPGAGGAELLEIPLSQAGKFLGKQAQVLLRDGRTLDGFLAAVEGDTLTLRQRQRVGERTFTIQFDKIRELRILM